MNETRKYVNVFASNGFTVKATFKHPVTLEVAREHGKSEAQDKTYMKYLGVLNVDITSKELKKLQRKMENDDFGPDNFSPVGGE